MFEGRWCILIKDKNKIKKNLNFLKKFWEKIGSKVTIMSPEKHDKIFSITSHIPHLVAYNMVKTAMNFEKKKKSNIVKFSAGGLRDFTRTAASNEIMWKDIFISNNENILKSIEDFELSLKELKELIKQQDDEAIVKFLKDTKTLRDSALEND